MLCPKHLVESFVACCEKSLTETFGNDPKAVEHYGRIVNERHFGRIKALLDRQLKVPGTRVAVGGTLDEKSLYIAPTLLTGVGKDPAKNPIMGEEIFGPILPIIAIGSVQEAIDYINSRFLLLSIIISSASINNPHSCSFMHF